jgi:hypothetical protein
MLDDARMSYRFARDFAAFWRGPFTLPPLRM